MALVTTGHGITDISGKSGGVVFARDKSGLHCRAHIPRRDPRTALQDKRRGAYSSALTAWKARPLTANEHSLWQAWTVRHPWHNAIGEVVHLSVFNAFIRYNLYLCYNGQPASYTPSAD